MNFDQAGTLNRLLAVMSPQDANLLASSLVFTDFPRGAVIAEPDVATTHAVFLECGIGSIIAVAQDGTKVEAGLFGRDGVSPVDAVLGADLAANRIVMQVAGQGWRISVPALAAASASSVPLRAILLRYVHTLMLQTSQTALSNALNTVAVRLARWLLMCDDRSDLPELPLTHEYIALMLAVRRPSVTEALHVLEGERLIGLARGGVSVRDRHGLEAFAGASYGRPEAAYERLIGPIRPPLAS